ncbi:MAG: hypothetical protein AAF725_18270 [Acidobacteriota bacterium]
MVSLLPPLLVLAAIVSYFALSAGAGYFQQVPWLQLIVALGACVWAASRAVKLKTLFPGASLLLSLGLTAFFAWYLFLYSAYEERTRQVQDGELLASLASLELPNHGGESAAVLAAAPKKATLLVFYRGFW